MKNLATGMEKDIHVSHKGQGAATNREKGQGAATNREKGQRKRTKGQTTIYKTHT
jgi:hypothetical protein